MKFLDKGIRLIDFFGINPRWYVRGYPRSNSPIGIFFTIIMMGFIFWAIVDFSNDFVNRTNPKVAFSNLAGVALSETFELNPDSFSYVFGIQNGESEEFYIDPTVYTLTGELVYQNLTKKNFTLVKCNPSDINISIGYSGDLLCFDRNRNDIYLSGINSIATLTFSMCKNSSDNNFQCKNQSDLDLIYSRKDQLFVFFPVSSAQLNNFSVPIIMNWNFQNFFLDSTLTKRLSLIPKKLEIVTDDGWVTSSVTTISRTVHEVFFSDIAYRIPGDFFSVEIFINGNIEHVSRSYQKLQDVLAQVMGITQTILIIIAILIIPYIRMKMFQYLGLEVFSLELKQKGQTEFQPTLEDLNTNQNQRPEYNPDLLGMRKQSASHTRRLSISYSKARKRFTDKKIRHLGTLGEPTLVKTGKGMGDLFGIIPEKTRGCCKKRVQKESTMIFSYVDWIMSFFKMSPKMLLANKLQEEITQRTDVETVLAKFMEIELLKRILFNDEQNVLFDNLCKPRMKLNYSIDSKNNLDYDFKLDDLLLLFAGDKIKAAEAYKTILGKAEKTPIDMELIMRYEKRRKRELNPKTQG